MNLPLFGIFIEGLLSFLSPCVLPLLPLYMSYLVGEDKTVDDNGTTKYKTGKVFVSTLFFVLGICFSFSLLAISANFLKQFISEFGNVVYAVCGVILIIFGLHEIGIININILNSDKRFRFEYKSNKMNLIKSFLLGFIFSFGWSPCIGPMLTNALILTVSETEGYLYIVFYGLGLTIPFLLTGLLTSSILNFFNSRKSIMKWVMKIAGIVMICFGLFMIVSSIDNKTFGNKADEIINEDVDNIFDYVFVNQRGENVNLSDYKGKYVILNFSTTWCTYCNSEIPEYLKFSNNVDDVVCLYVMSKSSSNVDDEQLASYIADNLSLDVLIDNNNYLFSYFGVNSYPTKFVISPSSEILGYIPGALNYDGFVSVIDSAKQIEKNKE